MSNEHVDTTIGSNVKIEGNLKNMGSIEVNGEVAGEIHSDENVVVGQTAKINGPIFAKNVTIAGEVVGPVAAREKLELLPSGQLEGDINMQLLVIQQGARFIGKSTMAAANAHTAAPTVETEPSRADEALTELLGEETDEAEPIES